MTSLDPRHYRRIRLMQILFAWDFEETQAVTAQGSPSIPEDWQLDPEEFGDLDLQLDAAELELAQTIWADRTKLDKQISEHAPERPLTDINKVDLAILRLIVFESNQTKTPKKVLVNEAVELAKAFGSDNSAKFVNGVLGRTIMTPLEAIEEQHDIARSDQPS